MPTKTYENIIFEREVSLAIQNLFIAPYGTTWTASPVTDCLSPPAGFSWLGAVVEDTPNMTVSREKFQLITGVPKVIQYQTVMQVAGRFECALYSNSPRKVQYALGNVKTHNILETDVTSYQTLAATNGHTRFMIHGSINPPAGWAVGDYIVAQASSTDTILVSQNESQITSISGTKIYVGTPGFPTIVPSWAGLKASKVYGAKLPLGTGLIRNFVLLGVADFIDGVQIIHKLDKVASAGEWSEQFRPDDVGKVPLAFDCYGISNADYGSSQLIVGERYWYPVGS